MPWLQLKLTTTKTYADAVGDELMMLGGLSVTLEDAADNPIYEPAPGETPLWNDIQMMVLFDAQINTDEVLAVWQENPFSEFTAHEKFEQVEDKDWVREWISRFEPMKFGERLWICPSWQPVPDETAVNVLLDPGLAFGTGTHPTTSLCLQWLDQADLHNKTVIDFGCGSGILAVAALKLGASKVYAVDIDPQAITATSENAKRNGVLDERLIIGQPEILGDVVVDVLVANILAGPLESLAEQISSHCGSHAKIALSGLLNHQVESVSQTYSTWFDMQQAENLQEWSRLTGTKK
ncbi:50S ribosomal protein L11 methyltransferase [Aliikangiella maris]|uniref:50S ribosomal protein L11 methyltransferase n=2 Tax=Aliikangiella maris TaxID=3162458 RepID=A0ABV2BY37_9GAMM